MDSKNVTDAAKLVLSALEPLQPDERHRVLEAARALYGAGSTRLSAAALEPPDQTDEAVPLVQTSAKKLSLVEFLTGVGPATNPQRIAAFAYYREHVEGKARFARADLVHYFAASKQPLPQNYDRDFTKAIRAGWVHEDGPNSYITGAGEAAVKTQFQMGNKK